MDWNTIVEGFKVFWSQPVPIIGFTVGTVIIGALSIISKTSIGKKALNSLKAKYNDLVNGYNEVKKQYDEIIAKKDEIITTMTEEYNNKLALIQANKDKEREVIIALGNCINNVKVKKIIEEYSQLDEITDVSQFVDDIKNKYESKYQELLAQIEELKNKFYSIEVIANGEREKGKDTVSAQETI